MNKIVYSFGSEIIEKIIFLTENKNLSVKKKSIVYDLLDDFFYEPDKINIKTISKIEEIINEKILQFKI